MPILTRVQKHLYLESGLHWRTINYVTINLNLIGFKHAVKMNNIKVKKCKENATQYTFKGEVIIFSPEIARVTNEDCTKVRRE